jgi:UDPglucose--hexose-1-phosphate uridylyltransferase
MEPVTQEELDTCPFCEGREDHTPPETFAIAPAGRAPDTPGWSVRVVPNKYPAFEHHEVVIHTPWHARSFGELSVEEAHAVAHAWTARAEAARAARYAHLQAVLNEGREAGGSLAHSHSQIVWLPEAPPLVRQEASDCAVCDVIQEARDHDRVVAVRQNIELLCPRAGRAPYEMLVAPADTHYGDAFAEPDELELALELLADGIRRLHTVEAPVPLNAWLHTAPFGRDGHWHIEVLPRFSIIAGLELGAGIYINSLAPEEAAQRLSSV